MKQLSCSYRECLRVRRDGIVETSADTKGASLGLLGEMLVEVRWEARGVDIRWRRVSWYGHEAAHKDMSATKIGLQS